MSVSVHVQEDPICNSRGNTVVLSNVEALRKEELERRRKLRLEQVRQQSKEFSNRILHKVQTEKEKTKENEKKEKEMELRRWQAERIKSLEQQYQDCLDSVRKNQDDKPQVSEEELRKQRLLQEKENIRKAKERGKQAMEKLKSDKLAEESKKEKELKQKQYSNTIEKLRSTLVTSREVLKDITTNGSVDTSTTSSETTSNTESRSDQPGPPPRATEHSTSRRATEDFPSQLRATHFQSQSKHYDKQRFEETVTGWVGVGQNGPMNTENKSERKNNEQPKVDGVKTKDQSDSSKKPDKDESIVETLEQERRKLMEYKLRLENEERKRQLLEEKLRMEQQTRLTEQLREENEKLRREKEEEKRRREEEEERRERGGQRKPSEDALIEQLREEENERKEKEEEERKLEEYRRELAKMREDMSEEELGHRYGRRREKKEELDRPGRRREKKDLMKVNIITSARRSKSCRGSRADSCPGHTDSDESFLSDRTWPPSQLYQEDVTDFTQVKDNRDKCRKCTSKKITHAQPPKRSLSRKTPLPSGTGGVLDRNLRAFEKERLNRDFKKLLGELEHLSREERRIKSRGCLLHDDPIFHMSETRRNQVERMKQNKMASAFEQLAASCNINPAQAGPTYTQNTPVTGPTYPNNSTIGGPIHPSTHKSAIGLPTHPNIVPMAGPNTQNLTTGLPTHTNLFENTSGLPLNPGPSQQANAQPFSSVVNSTESENVAKLKQLLDRINQKRAIIMQQLMNPKNQSECENLKRDLYTLTEESGVTQRVNQILNQQSDLQGLNQTLNQHLNNQELNRQGLNQQLNPRGLNQPSSEPLGSAVGGVGKMPNAVWTHVDREGVGQNGTDLDNAANSVPQNNATYSNPARNEPQHTQISPVNIGRTGTDEQVSVQRIIMHSQEVQTSFELLENNGANGQTQADTWHADLNTVSPGGRKRNLNQAVGATHSVSATAENVESPNARVKVSKSEVTVKAGGMRTVTMATKDAVTMETKDTLSMGRKDALSMETKDANSVSMTTAPVGMATDAYFYQVETTSSTTEIEVSLGPEEERRRKRYRHGGEKRVEGRKTFPPSPIGKVKQVRKTLFNDNIEVIVNIKDNLLSQVRGHTDHVPSGHGPQCGHLDQSYRERCLYYPDEGRPCPKCSRKRCDCPEEARPCPKCSRKRDCQTPCYCDGGSTDETRSSYMSPPRYIRTLHDKEINHLISAHSLHGKGSQMAFDPVGRGSQMAFDPVGTQGPMEHGAERQIGQQRVEESGPHRTRVQPDYPDGNRGAQGPIGPSEGQMGSQRVEENGPYPFDADRNRGLPYGTGEQPYGTRDQPYGTRDQPYETRGRPDYPDGNRVAPTGIVDPNTPHDYHTGRRDPENTAKEYGAQPKRHKNTAQAYANSDEEVLRNIKERMEKALRKPTEQNFDLRDRRTNVEKRKPPKQPVESVPKNDALLSYIVTLLNMDKKDISGIPIEVSDVSIASELFTSTSEQSDAGSDRVDQGLNVADRRTDGLNKVQTHRVPTQNNDENLRGKAQNQDQYQNQFHDRIDLDSRRNRNILAQKYGDIVQERARNDKPSTACEIFTELKARHLKPSEMARYPQSEMLPRHLQTEMPPRYPQSEMPSRHPSEMPSRYPQSEAPTDQPDVPRKPFGKPDIAFVKRLCNTREDPKPAGKVGKTARREKDRAVPRRDLEGASDVARAIANTGTKLPYKELFKMNPQGQGAQGTSYPQEDIPEYPQGKIPHFQGHPSYPQGHIEEYPQEKVPPYSHPRENCPPYLQGKSQGPSQPHGHYGVAAPTFQSKLEAIAPLLKCNPADLPRYDGNAPHQGYPLSKTCEDLTGYDGRQTNLERQGQRFTKDERNQEQEIFINNDVESRRERTKHGHRRDKSKGRHPKERHKSKDHRERQETKSYRIGHKDIPKSDLNQRTEKSTKDQECRERLPSKGRRQDQNSPHRGYPQGTFQTRETYPQATHQPREAHLQATHQTKGPNHPHRNMSNLPSGDESTIYLNLPRKFQHVENVAVQERLDKSLDTSDLLEGLAKVGKEGKDRSDPNKLRNGINHHTGKVHEKEEKRVRDQHIHGHIQKEPGKGQEKLNHDRNKPKGQDRLSKRPDFARPGQSREKSCWDANRWKTVRDICGGVGVTIDANVRPDGRPAEYDGRVEGTQYDGRGGLSGREEGQDRPLNNSMDLQVPDLCLEHPSQHSSGRKSGSDLNSTLPKDQPTPGWNTADSLVQELMRRGIIDQPFPWLWNETGSRDEERSRDLDRTDLTEVLRRFLESDTGSSEKPPNPDTTQQSLPNSTPTTQGPIGVSIGPQNIPHQPQTRVENGSQNVPHSTGENGTQTGSSGPQSNGNGKNGSNGGTNGVSNGTNGISNGTNEISNGSTMNKTTASMRQRKTDLMSIFEEYKRDIHRLLHVLPSTAHSTRLPSDLETTDKILSPLDTTDTSNNKTIHPSELDENLISLEDTSDGRDINTDLGVSPQSDNGPRMKNPQSKTGPQTKLQAKSGPQTNTQSKSHPQILGITSLVDPQTISQVHPSENGPQGSPPSRIIPGTSNKANASGVPKALAPMSSEEFLDELKALMGQDTPSEVVPRHLADDIPEENMSNALKHPGNIPRGDLPDATFRDLNEGTDPNAPTNIPKNVPVRTNIPNTRTNIPDTDNSNALTNIPAANTAENVPSNRPIPRDLGGIFSRGINPDMGSSINRQGSPTTQLSSPTNHRASPINQLSSPTNMQSGPTNQLSSPTNGQGGPTNHLSSPRNRQGSPTNHSGSPEDQFQALSAQLSAIVQTNASLTTEWNHLLCAAISDTSSEDIETRLNLIGAQCDPLTSRSGGAWMKTTYKTIRERQQRDLCQSSASSPEEVERKKAPPRARKPRPSPRDAPSQGSDPAGGQRVSPPPNRYLHESAGTTGLTGEKPSAPRGSLALPDSIAGGIETSLAQKFFPTENSIAGGAKTFPAREFFPPENPEVFRPGSESFADFKSLNESIGSMETTNEKFTNLENFLREREEVVCEEKGELGGSRPRQSLEHQEYFQSLHPLRDTQHTPDNPPSPTHTSSNKKYIHSTPMKKTGQSKSSPVDQLKPSPLDQSKPLKLCLCIPCTLCPEMASCEHALLCQLCCPGNQETRYHGNQERRCLDNQETRFHSNQGRDVTEGLITSELSGIVLQSRNDGFSSVNSREDSSLDEVSL
ncbi:hypothetical protein M8J77_017006 [Diaphorina citri]|nr:hypothetical protein M8J77_017006 [Diaphorina citri]